MSVPTDPEVLALFMRYSVYGLLAAGMRFTDDYTEEDAVEKYLELHPEADEAAVRAVLAAEIAREGAQPPKLQLVPPGQPTPAEKIFLRHKQIPRPAGMLQCNRCGSRAMLTVVTGVIIDKSGRKQNRGTVIDKDVCASCWKQGIIVPMRPAVKAAERTRRS
jgi:hypothetical protein